LPRLKPGFQEIKNFGTWTLVQADCFGNVNIIMVSAQAKAWVPKMKAKAWVIKNKNKK